MSNSYSVTISMDASTVTDLIKYGYSLYGWKVVSSSQQGGLPLVWFQTNKFSTTTVVEWTEQYGAYSSTQTDVGANTVVIASDSKDANLGVEVWIETGGVVSVQGVGDSPQALTIWNKTEDLFTCGISQQVNGKMSPMCAFPLLGGMLADIAPVEQVFLMFATEQVSTGEVITRSYSYGALIDLTASSSVTAQYALGPGAPPTQWSPAPAVSPVDPESELLPLLITSSAPVPA